MEKTDKTQYSCAKCNYTTIRKSDYNKHCKSTKHITGERKERINKKNYNCSICNYETINKNNYQQHMLNNHTTNEDRKAKFKYFCEPCNFGIQVESLYTKHCGTNKHNRKIKN